MADKRKEVPKGNLIFRRFRRLRNGRLLDAWDYGYKGWPIPVRR
jgi:hypothetical protein